jgi:SAM-dependent methyltransferase
VEERVYEQLYELEDRHWWFRGRRQVIWAMVRQVTLPVSPRILDAGCGTGRNLLEYGGLGKACGIDPSPDAIEFCRRRGLGNVAQASLEALPFDDGSFDLMLACDVIEHVDDELAALRELRRVAALGASLLITVPAYMWLWSQHDESHHHKRRYTLRRLRERVAAAGFRPGRATYFNSALLLPIALVRKLGRRSGSPNGRSDYELAPEVLQRWLELPLRGEAWLVERGVTLPAGVSIGMLCAAQ